MWRRRSTYMGVHRKHVSVRWHFSCNTELKPCVCYASTNSDLGDSTQPRHRICIWWTIQSLEWVIYHLISSVSWGGNVSRQSFHGSNQHAYKRGSGPLNSDWLIHRQSTTHRENVLYRSSTSLVSSIERSYMFPSSVYEQPLDRDLWYSIFWQTSFVHRGLMRVEHWAHTVCLYCSRLLTPFSHVRVSPCQVRVYNWPCSPSFMYQGAWPISTGLVAACVGGATMRQNQVVATSLCVFARDLSIFPFFDWIVHLLRCDYCFTI